MAITLRVNGQTREVAADPETPLLYTAQRSDAERRKFGCVRPVRRLDREYRRRSGASCSVPIGSLTGKSVTTLKARHAEAHPRSLHRRAGRAVRLLHQRHDHCGGRPAQAQSAADRSRGSQRARRQSVSLRQPPRIVKDQTRGEGDGMMSGLYLSIRHAAVSRARLIVSFSPNT
jgi:hypothetical protein